MVDFLRYRSITAVFSIVMIASCAGMFLYNYSTRGYAFVYSVDFTGGTQVLLKFNQEVGTDKLRDIFEKKEWSGVMVRTFGPQEVEVRVKEFSNDVKGVAERMRAAVQEALPDSQVTVLKSEGVGAGIGADLRWKSIRAVLFALLAMLAYIAFRFWSLAFALGAVVALFHDSLAMLAIFLFFDREISVNVIGAILAVLGYSINDTIVIFSQIRDNFKKASHLPLGDVVNMSLNQTLRRTFLTSVTTSLTVGAMLILGGEALRDFSLALLVGIVFGTYSSVYIASPVMLALGSSEK